MHGRPKIKVSQIKGNRVRITLRLDKSTYKEIRRISDQIKTSESRTIEAIVEKYLERVPY